MSKIALMIVLVATISLAHCGSAAGKVTRNVPYDAAGRLTQLDIYAPRYRTRPPGHDLDSRWRLATGRQTFREYETRGVQCPGIRIGQRQLSPVSASRLCSASSRYRQGDSVDSRQHQQHRGDANKLFVMGHSAGALLAALVSIDGQYLQKEKLKLRISVA